MITTRTTLNPQRLFLYMLGLFSLYLIGMDGAFAQIVPDNLDLPVDPDGNLGETFGNLVILAVTIIIVVGLASVFGMGIWAILAKMWDWINTKASAGPIFVSFFIVLVVVVFVFVLATLGETVIDGIDFSGI